MSSYYVFWHRLNEAKANNETRIKIKNDLRWFTLVKAFADGLCLWHSLAICWLANQGHDSKTLKSVQSNDMIQEVTDILLQKNFPRIDIEWQRIS